MITKITHLLEESLMKKSRERISITFMNALMRALTARKSSFRPSIPFLNPSHRSSTATLTGGMRTSQKPSSIRNG